MGPYAWEKTMENKMILPLHPDGTRCIQKEPSRSTLCNNVQSTNVVRSRGCLLPDDIKDLPRSADVFRRMDQDPVLSYRLPGPRATAGKVLEHACSTFQSLMRQWQPITFKFGITHCPSFRWHNQQFGYKFSLDPFDELLVVYACGNPHGPAFLEAALIEKFGSYEVAILD